MECPRATNHSSQAMRVSDKGVYFWCFISGTMSHISAFCLPTNLPSWADQERDPGLDKGRLSVKWPCFEEPSVAWGTVTAAYLRAGGEESHTGQTHILERPGIDPNETEFILKPLFQIWRDQDAENTCVSPQFPDLLPGCENTGPNFLPVIHRSKNPWKQKAAPLLPTVWC